MENKCPAIPRLNDHGSGCKGHANWMLDVSFENWEDRKLMIDILENYIKYH